MTLAAVGSAITPVVTAKTFPLTPRAIGDVIVIEVISATAADYATALSSSNVTWDASPLVAHTSLSANAVVSTVFKGRVTAASLATVTVTTAAGSPTLRIAGLELSTTAGYSAVTLDASGTVNAATTLCPSLTPAHGAGEAYFYFGFNSASATAGSTSGYTYAADANGNGLCYDAACGSGAQQPAFGASDTISGIAVLLYEAGTPHTVTASLIAAPSRSASAGRGRSRSASLTAAPSLLASGDETGPASSRSASLATAPSRSATAARGHARSATASVTPSRSTAHVQAHARHASLTGSPSLSAVPAGGNCLVQETSGSTTGTSLTLTFGAPTTAGSSVIVAVCGYFGGTVSAITLSSGAGTFTQAAASGSNNAQVWTHLGSTAPAASLVITTTAAGILAWAYEVSGNVAFDTSGANSGTSSSWSSGATGTTIPYEHFIVGLGTIVSNTGSITGPGSGWTNETAITNVVGAGSHAIGGVSGFRQSSTATTFTYAGTSGTSSAWGAVTAAFLVMPSPVFYNTIWCGIKFTEHASAGYTGVSATVTLPSTLPSTPSGALGSVWVGMGPAINQTGVYFGYNAADAGGVGTAPWSWWIPGAGERWDQSAYPSGAGDSMTFAMQLTPENWVMTMTNNTRSWTYTEVMSVLATNLNSWNPAATTPYAPTTPTWVFPQNSAVVIIEKEAASLPEFGTLNFTSVTTTPAYTQEPELIFAVNAGIDDYPTPFNLAAGTFSIVWNAYS